MCDFLLLSTYWDDELPEPEKSRLADHVSACPHCQAWLRGLAALTRTIALFPHAPVPPGFAERVIAKVAEPPSIGEALRSLPAYEPKADFLSRLMAKLPVCPSFETLSAWVDGELDGEDTVSTHLPACGVCRKRVDQLQLLSGAVRDLPMAQPVRAVSETVLALGLCPSVADVSAWVDGEAAGLDDHLATCADCRRTAEAMRSLGQQLRALPVPVAATRLCPDVAEFVTDEALPADLTDHLETCAPCRTRMHRWSVLGGLLRQLPAPAVAQGFAERVVAALPACPEGDDLHAYHDGELIVSDRATVRQHLETCSPCQAKVNTFAKLSAAVAALPDHQAPTGFAFGVAARVPSDRRMRRWPAAVAAGFLVVGFLIFQEKVSGPNSSTMAVKAVPVALANVNVRSEDLLLADYDTSSSVGMLDEWSQ